MTRNRFVFTAVLTAALFVLSLLPAEAQAQFRRWNRGYYYGPSGYTYSGPVSYGPPYYGSYYNRPNWNYSAPYSSGYYGSPYSSSYYGNYSNWGAVAPGVYSTTPGYGYSSFYSGPGMSLNTPLGGAVIGGYGY